MSARLPVKGGYWTLVDEDVAERFKGVSLFLDKSGYARFAGRRADGAHSPVFLHRRVLQLDGVKGLIVDHVNGNRLDNRRENLRLVTETQSAWNRAGWRRNASGFKGVTWNRFKQKFAARIMCSKRAVFIGYFATAEEAARAYDQKAVELRGAEAVLNFAPGLRGFPLASLKPIT